jgi:hypothetical protein
MDFAQLPAILNLVFTLKIKTRGGLEDCARGCRIFRVPASDL